MSAPFPCSFDAEETLTLSRTGKSSQDSTFACLIYPSIIDPMGTVLYTADRPGMASNVWKGQVSRGCVKTFRKPSSCSASQADKHLCNKPDDILTFSGYRADAQLASCPCFIHPDHRSLSIDIKFLLDRIEGWFTQPALPPGDAQLVGVPREAWEWALGGRGVIQRGDIFPKCLDAKEVRNGRRMEAGILAALYPIGNRTQQPLFESRLLPLATGIFFGLPSHH